MGNLIERWIFRVIPVPRFTKDKWPNDPAKEMSVIHLGKILRKLYYVIFRRQYVLKSIKNRKGACKACGCCKVSWFYSNCKYFDKSNGLCLLWKEKGIDAIPFLCRLYPFDEKDKCEYSKTNCGYYW